NAFVEPPGVFVGRHGFREAQKALLVVVEIIEELGARARGRGRGGLRRGGRAGATLGEAGRSNSHREREKKQRQNHRFQLIAHKDPPSPQVARHSSAVGTPRGESFSGGRMQSGNRDLHRSVFASGSLVPLKKWGCPYDLGHRRGARVRFIVTMGSTQAPEVLRCVSLYPLLGLSSWCWRRPLVLRLNPPGRVQSAARFWARMGRRFPVRESRCNRLTAGVRRSRKPMTMGVSGFRHLPGDFMTFAHFMTAGGPTGGETCGWN